MFSLRDGLRDIYEELEELQRAEHEEELSGLAEIYQASRGSQLLSRLVTLRVNGEVVTTETFSRGDWTARAWMMARRHPERYARRCIFPTAQSAGSSPVSNRIRRLLKPARGAGRCRSTAAPEADGWVGSGAEKSYPYWTGAVARSYFATTLTR
ncbi:MAG TPA: hypothetical protein VGY99_26595 [Candidatus Binataceae bacterium]|jgi:hypothetical protein|nr:hypothetical protein [Candidatus Binataceae bacterium]